MKVKFGDKASTQNGERTVMGYYRHNGPEPISNTRRDFESAAYSETTEIPPGVYPILPGWNHYGRDGGEPTLYIEFKGTVTDDYFPTSLGGVPIGTTKPKHLGEPRTITRRLDVALAIKDTGITPNKTPNKDGKISPDVYIDPKYWQDILEYYQTLLDKDVQYMVKVATSKEELKDKTGSLRYASACVNDTATKVEKIAQAIEYQKNPTFRNYTIVNSQWIKEAEDYKKEQVDKGAKPPKLENSEGIEVN